MWLSTDDPKISLPNPFVSYTYGHVVSTTIFYRYSGFRMLVSCESGMRSVCLLVVETLDLKKKGRAGVLFEVREFRSRFV
jgi:hypothetical protein